MLGLGFFDNSQWYFWHLKVKYLIKWPTKWKSLMELVLDLRVAPFFNLGEVYVGFQNVREVHVVQWNLKEGQSIFL